METENVKIYGKFKSAEELFAAYNALEREFTKRCQLIKELQTAGEQACAQKIAEKAETPSEEATAAEPVVSNEEATGEAKAIEAAIENVCAAAPQEEKENPAPTEDPSRTQDDLCQSDVMCYVIKNADGLAETLSDIPQVMDACIAKYKQKLIGMGATIGAVRGAAVITPVRRPKTLIEAKILADEMLR